VAISKSERGFGLRRWPASLEGRRGAIQRLQKVDEVG
jgi:hypothetical protein